MYANKTDKSYSNVIHCYIHSLKLSWLVNFSYRYCRKSDFGIETSWIDYTPHICIVTYIAS